jgi:hypothetical protein
VKGGGMAELLFAYNSGPYAEGKVDPMYANKVMAMIDLLIIFESQESAGNQFAGLKTGLFKP